MSEAEARQRIERAGGSGARRLDLTGLGLERIPSDLHRRAPGLEVLYLHGNALTTVPSTLGLLADLHTLTLSYNELTSLPTGLARLVKLRSLRLQQNRLTSVPEAIGRLSALVELRLDDNALTSLPPGLGQLSELVELRVDGNDLAELPSELGRLSALRTLHLDRNRLAGIPPELAALEALVDLRLDGGLNVHRCPVRPARPAHRYLDDCLWCTPGRSRPEAPPWDDGAPMPLRAPTPASIMAAASRPDRTRVAASERPSLRPPAPVIPRIGGIPYHELAMRRRDKKGDWWRGA